MLICSCMLLSFGKSLCLVLDRFAWLVDRKLDLHHRVRHFNWFSGIDFVDKLFSDLFNFARCLFSMGFQWDIHYCNLAHMLLSEFILWDQYFIQLIGIYWVLYGCHFFCCWLFLLTVVEFRGLFAALLLLVLLHFFFVLFGNRFFSLLYICVYFLLPLQLLFHHYFRKK